MKIDPNLLDEQSTFLAEQLDYNYLSEHEIELAEGLFKLLGELREKAERNKAIKFDGFNYVYNWEGAVLVESDRINEWIEGTKEQLKSEEPYHYIASGDVMVIGFNYGDEVDDEVYVVEIIAKANI